MNQCNHSNHINQSSDNNYKNQLQSQFRQQENSMTHEELTAKVEALEALITAGSDYAAAEIQARELLYLFPLNKGEKGGLNIRVRTLLALSQSL